MGNLVGFGLGFCFDFVKDFLFGWFGVLGAFYVLLLFHTYLKLNRNYKDLNLSLNVKPGTCYTNLIYMKCRRSSNSVMSH